MAHTPGSWKIEHEDHALVIVAPWSDAVKPGDTETFGDYRGAHICRIKYIDDDSVPTERQAMSNAALICAAPDLLEALKACLPYLPITGDTYNSDHKVMQKAIAAIDKAEATK